MRDNSPDSGTGVLIPFRQQGMHLPVFAWATGLRPHDISRFGADVTADASGLRFTERAADGHITGVLTVLGEKKQSFTRGCPRALCTSTVCPGAGRIVVCAGGLAALCAAAAEKHRPDTIYVAAPGSWTTLAKISLEALLARTVASTVVITVRAGGAGQRLGERAVEIVGDSWGGLVHCDLMLMEYDWPEMLRRQRGAGR